MFFNIALAATLVILIVTVLPMFRHEAWWVRGMDFPRLQFSCLIVALLIFDALTLSFSDPSSWGIIIVALLCLCYQLWWIIPYTKVYPVEVKTAQEKNPQDAVTIMNVNVLASNRNSSKLIELIQQYQPDLLVTLESNQWWQEQLDTLKDEYPYTIKCPLENLYGMHVYSKFKLTDAKVEFLVEPEVPSIHALLTLPSEKTVRVHFLHPAPPSPIENEKSSERDAELLIVGKSIEHSLQPVIVTGDLNDVAWSSTTLLFRKISGLLDPRVGRGMFNTFHAHYWFLRWPLDHIFHSHHFTVASINRLPKFGSDHFALLTKLYYENGSNAKEAGLDEEKGDRAWANEKIQNQDVHANDVPTPGE